MIDGWTGEKLDLLKRMDFGGGGNELLGMDAPKTALLRHLSLLGRNDLRNIENIERVSVQSYGEIGFLQVTGCDQCRPFTHN